MTARNLDIIHINLHSGTAVVIWVSFEDVCLGSPRQSFLPYTPPPQGALPFQRWTLGGHHTPTVPSFKTHVLDWLCSSVVMLAVQWWSST